jgi:hypothetical protein
LWKCQRSVLSGAANAPRGPGRLFSLMDTQGVGSLSAEEFRTAFNTFFPDATGSWCGSMAARQGLPSQPPW